MGVKKSGVADGVPSVVGMGMSNCVVGMGMVGNTQARPVLSRELRSGLATVMEGHDGRQDRMKLGRTGAVYLLPHSLFPSLLPSLFPSVSTYAHLLSLLPKRSLS